MTLIHLETPDRRTTTSIAAHLGGLVTSIQMPDYNAPHQKRELLYLPKDFDLNKSSRIRGGLPLCFPTCGRLTRDGIADTYLYRGQRYQIGIHGFAHSLSFTVIKQAPAQVTLKLSATPETLAQYPFHFEVELTYQIEEGLLRCHQVYRNLGNEPMPYYAGFHPYFWIDPARYEKSQVKLSAKPIARYLYNSTLNDVIGQEAPPHLPEVLSAPHLNEQLLRLEEHAAELHFPDGYVLRLQARGNGAENLFPFLQLYHDEKEPFFCVESWMGHPNGLNTVGVPRWIKPQDEEHALFTLSLFAFL